MSFLTTLRSAIATAETRLKAFFGGDATLAPHPVADALAESLKATHDALADLTQRVSKLEGADAAEHPILAAANQGVAQAELQGTRAAPSPGAAVAGSVVTADPNAKTAGVINISGNAGTPNNGPE